MTEVPYEKGHSNYDSCKEAIPPNLLIIIHGSMKVNEPSLWSLTTVSGLVDATAVEVIQLFVHLRIRRSGSIADPKSNYRLSVYAAINHQHSNRPCINKSIFLCEAFLSGKHHLLTYHVLSSLSKLGRWFHH